MSCCYWHNATATAETLVDDGWLRTGDIGTRDANGFYFIVDRLKELIKVKGFQVAPAELEAVLLSHAAVADCAVVGVPDRADGEVPKAFIVKRAQATVSDQELLKFVAEKVASYKRIRYIQYIDSIPRNPSGKILRRQLKALAKL